MISPNSTAAPTPNTMTTPSGPASTGSARSTLRIPRPYRSQPFLSADQGLGTSAVSLSAADPRFGGAFHFCPELPEQVVVTTDEYAAALLAFFGPAAKHRP